MPDTTTENEVLTCKTTGRYYDFQDQVGHLIRRVYQRNMFIFQQAFAKSGITSVQYAVLCALAKKGASPLSALGRATAIDPATLRGVVDRLAARELVDISNESNDKRKVIVNLTVKGEEFMASTVTLAFGVNEETVEMLNPVEHVAFLALLKKIDRGHG